MPGQGGLDRVRVLGVPGEVCPTDLVGVDALTADDPVVGRLVVEAPGVDHRLLARGVHARQHGSARVDDVLGQAEALADARGEGRPDRVAGVVQGAHLVEARRAGPVVARADLEQVRRDDAVVGDLALPQLGQRLLGDRPDDGGRQGASREGPPGGLGDQPDVVVLDHGRHERDVARRAHDDVRGVEAREPDDGHPDDPRLPGQHRGQLRRAEREVVVVVAHRLRDQQPGPAEPPAELRQVGGRELVHGRHPDGREAPAVEEDPQRLGLAVAHHEGDRPVALRLAQTVEVAVVTGAAVGFGSLFGHASLRPALGTDKGGRAGLC
ncbi:hypothetical protein FRIGORI9N_510020 [Frigoribacterium sp. 9N]|nr:hypothetical protein FRIGORI9N_510020 [Frigoribacterium sp. 9N]